MTIEELLNKSEYQFPYSYNGTYINRVFDILDKYKKNIATLVYNDIDIKRLNDDIIRICNSLFHITENYLHGHAYSAHVDLFELMDSVKSDILSDIFVSSLKPNLNGLYKIRNVEKDNMQYSCNDNYIIPIDMANYIGTNRFSIPGYPSLYVGSSSYVCSLEIPKVKSKNRIISRYEIWDGVLNNILYLHYLPRDIIEAVNDKRWEHIKIRLIDSYLRVLPILLIIYHKVQKTDGPFRPEYILGQMITQWARINNIHAICYLSTKIDYSNVPKRIGLNFVFPSQTPDVSFENVHAFNSKFYLTKPLLMKNKVIEELYRLNKKSLKFVDDYGRYSIEPTIMLNNSNYWKTYYGKIDLLLQNMLNISPNSPDFNNAKDIQTFEYSTKYEMI